MTLRNLDAPRMLFNANGAPGGAAPGAAAGGDPAAGAPGAAGGADPAAAAAAPGAADAAADPAAVSLAAGGAKEPPAAKQPPADFPADWREKIAGTDQGKLNTLKRYASPIDAINWVLDQQAKISKGELKPVKPMPGKDATAEQVAAWRKEQGLPENAEGYLGKLSLPQGMLLGDADKPIAQAFAERALERGMSQEHFNDTVNWYFEQQAQQAQARVEADGEFQRDSQQKLMAEWGADFKGNSNALGAFWQEAPEGVRDIILGARTADGKIVGDHPQVAAFFAGLMRQLNPAATLLPAGQGDLQGVSTRKAAIEGMMYLNGKQNPAYWGNEALQQEYRDLIAAEQRMKGGNAAAA